MTTIAWDGSSLCVDSQSTIEDCITSINEQKLWLGVGKYSAVAMCGDIKDFPAIVKWLKNGHKRPLENINSTAICVREDGRCVRFIEGSNAPEKIDDVFADGSGWKIALAVMKAGGTAKKALKTARKLDVYTGGKIHQYRSNA